MKPPVRVESVESVEGGHAGLAHEGLLLGVDPDVDLDSGHSVVTIYSLGIPGHLEGVRGEELLAALLAPVLVVRVAQIKKVIVLMTYFLLSDH